MKLRRRCQLQSLATTVVFCLLTQGAILAQVTVKVASGSAIAGAAASLNISLTSSSGTAPAAVEWTLDYSSSDLTGMTLAAGSAATSAGKSLSCTSTTGSARCIVSGRRRRTPKQSGEN